jgi:hypothetical protein
LGIDIERSLEGILWLPTKILNPTQGIKLTNCKKIQRLAINPLTAYSYLALMLQYLVGFDPVDAWLKTDDKPK